MSTLANGTEHIGFTGYMATEHIGLHFVSPPERSDFRPMKAGCDVSDYFGVV